jgi:hypothetical protein
VRQALRLFGDVPLRVTSGLQVAPQPITRGLASGGLLLQPSQALACGVQRSMASPPSKRCRSVARTRLTKTLPGPRH